MTPGRCALLAAQHTLVHRQPVSVSRVHCPFVHVVMSSYRLLLFLLPMMIAVADAKPAPATKDNAPSFNSWQQLGLGQFGQGTLASGVDPLSAAGNVASSVLSSLGLHADGNRRRAPAYSETRSLPETSYQSDGGFASFLGNTNTVDLQGIASGQIPGLAPIPVPGYPGPQDVPTIPGVNTIPGLSNFNYLVGQLIPQVIPPTNTLLGSSISRLLPQDSTKNLAKDVFRAVHPAAEDVEVERMMGRWFQVINSPHVIREACTVSHFGALTNNTYSATFTVLKFYREGNPNGPPRFSLGYGFTSGDHGQFVLHNSNSPDAEPFWVIKKGPLNEYNQYDYAVVSNWVRFPVFVIARDPERFQKVHMRQVLQFLEDNNYINVMTKAFNMISPVDYSQCQYTPTFSGAG